MHMEVDSYKGEPVLITGTGMLVHSVAVCLIRAGHPVSLQIEDRGGALRSIGAHFDDLEKYTGKKEDQGVLKIIESLPGGDPPYKLVVIIAGENVGEKRAAIHKLEKRFPPHVLFGVTTESIPIDVLQVGCDYPERVVGLNWTEPAHTTYFLEIIRNAVNSNKVVDAILHTAKKVWKKDPYVVSNGISIRAKLFAAMAREAFYLVQNGFASVEDIDKSCRNDAGYYLPFAGNFRYMDLMGTSAYGIVMKDLNRELSNAEQPPPFFRKIIEKGGLGMENNFGFYSYEHGDTSRWNEEFRKFSHQIQQIIRKYPFNGEE